MENSRIEWLKWRSHGICASEAAALHGASPWFTRFELGEKKLTELKTGKVEEEQNFIYDKGNVMEAKARAKFASLYNLDNGTDEDFAPRRIEHKELPFLRASLDGATRDLVTALAEFKFMHLVDEDRPASKEPTPGQIKHENVLREDLPITAPDSIMVRVPFHYWIQMQHQLMVTGAKICYFVSDNGKTQNVCPVLPDVEFMKKHLKLCIEFWDLILAKKSQPIGPEDFKELRTKGAKGKAQEWARLDTQIKELEEKREALADELKKMLTHPRMTCGPVKFQTIAGRQGSIDYQRMLKHPILSVAMEANGIDPEKYRKPDAKGYIKMEVMK